MQDIYATEVPRGNANSQIVIFAPNLPSADPSSHQNEQQSALGDPHGHPIDFEKHSEVVDSSNLTAEQNKAHRGDVWKWLESETSTRMIVFALSLCSLFSNS